MNLIESARYAGFKGKDGSLSVTANRLANDPIVIAEIEKLKAATQTKCIMSRDQALQILSEIGSGVIGLYLGDYGEVDMKKVREANALHLISGTEITLQGRKIKFHDKMHAIEMLAKLEGWFKQPAPDQINGPTVSLEIKMTTEKPPNANG